MIKVDLITGFLGAGKTTFIRKYLSYLKKLGVKAAVIENEFGSQKVDTHILEREDAAASFTDLTGLCMCCAGKDEFIYQLKQASECGIDRVIVEPSGIYDADEFFDVMLRDDVSEKCETGSIITITDPVMNSNVSNEAEYLMFCQTACAGVVIISKTQCVKPKKIFEGIEALNALMKKFGCESGITVPIVTQPWDELSDADMNMIMESGCNRTIHERMQFDHSAAFDTMCISGSFRSKTEMEGKIRRAFRAKACGTVFRIKGTAFDADGSFWEVNCTGTDISIKQVEKSESGLVIIGRNLKEVPIRSILEYKDGGIGN